jgi:hypothetical protein
MNEAEGMGYLARRLNRGGGGAAKAAAERNAAEDIVAIGEKSDGIAETHGPGGSKA